MTNRDNGGPGKTRHLNDIAASCEALGMCVICVNAAERDFWLSASQQYATAPDGKARVSLRILQRGGHCFFLGKAGSGMRAEGQQVTRIFLAKSDVSQIEALYSDEDGERLSAAIRDNCSVWFPLNPGGNGNDA